MALRRQLRRSVKDTVRRLGYDVVNLRYHDSLHDHLRALFRRYAIDCVLDVGARHGDYADALRAFGYDGAIVSFEPIALNYRILTARAAGDARWHTRQIALGANNGEPEINVSRDTQFSSFLEPNEYAQKAFGEDPRVERRERVVLRRLDDVFDEVVPAASRRIFLKIDTQGYDLEVIDGASAVFDRVTALQIELAVNRIYDASPFYMDVIGSLTDAGFSLTGLYAVNRDPSLRVVDFDCVMVRPAL